VLGLLLAVQAVPRAVLMLLGGVLADRYHPRTLLVATNALQGLLVAAVAVVMAADRLTLGHLVAYAAASGVVYAASVPAAPALVPQLVPRARLRAANALTSLNFNLAVAVYAPLGGLLVARVGPAPAFAFNALSFFVAAGAVWLVRAPGRPRASGPGGGGALTQLRAGVALARADPVVWTAILAATGYSLGATGATLVGVPALASLSLGAGSAGVGLLYGALGLGATAGTVALGSLRGLRHPGRWAGLTLLGLGLALASTAAAPTVAWAAAALALAGLLRGAGANIYVTLVQAHAPDAARGRVMGLFMLGVMGLAPLSMAAGGLLGSLLGPRALLAGGGLVVAAAGVFALSRRPFREAA
jgi:MFS family permease